MNDCPSISMSALRAWLLSRPASLPHVIATAMTARKPPSPTMAIPARSRPVATTSCSTWMTLAAFCSSLSASSTAFMTASGSLRLAMAKRMRLSRLPLEAPSGWESRSSTTATVQSARPDEMPRPTSRFWTARKTSRPRPEAPMMAAIPTMAMASINVWFRPAMIDGLANGNWTSVNTRSSEAP